MGMSDPKNIEAPEAPKTDCDLRTRQKRERTTARRRFKAMQPRPLKQWDRIAVRKGTILWVLSVTKDKAIVLDERTGIVKVVPRATAARRRRLRVGGWHMDKVRYLCNTCGTLHRLPGSVLWRHLRPRITEERAKLKSKGKARAKARRGRGGKA